MADSAATRSIKTVVDELLAKTRNSQSERTRWLQLAFDAYRDLRLYVLPDTVHTKLDMSAINTVDLPEDCLNIVAIGIPKNGQLWTLTQKDEMIKTTTLVGLTETLDSDEGEGVEISNNTMTGYSTVGGVNKSGYYSVDWEKRRIWLNGFDRTSVVLVYVSSGASSSDLSVPVVAVPAIENYVLWKHLFYLMDNKAPYYEQSYTTEKKKLKHLLGDNLQAIKDMIYRTSTPLFRR